MHSALPQGRKNPLQEVPPASKFFPTTSLEGTSDKQVHLPLRPCSGSKTSPCLFSHGLHEFNSEAIISTAVGCLVQSTRNAAHCLKEWIPQHTDGNKKECEV